MRNVLVMQLAGELSSIKSMKVSVSLSPREVGFLDAETSSGRYQSRSSAVAAAIGLLMEQQLVDSYVEAFDEWATSGGTDLWETTAGDGLGSPA